MWYLSIHPSIYPSIKPFTRSNIYIFYLIPPHTHINYSIDTDDAFCIQMHVKSISPCFLIILATLVSVSWFVFMVSWPSRGACELLHALSGREGRLRLLVFEGAGSQRWVPTEKMLPFRSNSRYWTKNPFLKYKILPIWMMLFFPSRL